MLLSGNARGLYFVLCFTLRPGVVAPPSEIILDRFRKTCVKLSWYTTIELCCGRFPTSITFRYRFNNFM
jgi:hypothetical protein